MSNRRFEMYQYRQIIFRLRQGESIRSISYAKLADRKKTRQIRQIAQEQGWLNLEKDQSAHTPTELTSPTQDPIPL